MSLPLRRSLGEGRDEGSVPSLRFKGTFNQVFSGWRLLLAVLLLAGCAVAPAFPSFDPFLSATNAGGTAYAVGAGLYDQTNAVGECWSLWNGGSGSSTAQVTCVNSNVSYGGFPAAFPGPPAFASVLLPGSDLASGGAAGYSAALQLSQAVTADPANLVTNRIYASFLLQVPNLGDLSSASPIYFGGFATNSGNQSIGLPSKAMKIYLKGNAASGSTSYSIGVEAASGSGGSAAYDAGGHTANQVFFVVVDYEFGLNGGPDTLRLWVNPAGSTFGAAAHPSPIATLTTASSSAQLGTAADFYLLARTGTTLWGSLLVADLRVGNTWTFVTGGPGIISPPLSQTNLLGTTASFSVGAIGGTTNAVPLHYQWAFSGTNLVNGGNVAGATNTTLSVSNLSPANAGTYSVVVTNPIAAVTNSAALTVASVIVTNSENDDLSVTSYGAVGDGITDDTAAFQSALDAAHTSNRNGVSVPMGHYVLSGSLTISNLELIGKFEGGWPADTMPLPTLLIRHYQEPALKLMEGASVHGLALDYDEGSPDTTNAPAMSLQGNGISITSVRIQNPYDGITTTATAQPGRARFANVLILQPVDVGVQITKCYDFVQYSHIEVRCTGAMSTGAAFSFGRVDEGGYVGLVASNCATGIAFYTDEATNDDGGTFTGGFAACSIVACGTGITATGNHKIKFSGCDIAGLNYGGVINGTNAEVIITGTKWQANTNQAILAISAGNLILDGDTFYRPVPVANPFVWVQSCTTVTVNNSQFLPGSTGLELDAGVQRAVVVGNSFEDGGVTNNMTSGMSAIADNLITDSPPGNLAATAGVGQVALTWTAALGATSYNIKRSITNGGPYATIANQAATAYTDAAVTNGTTYYYVVSTLRGATESANSSQVSATPNAPVSLSVSAPPGAGQVTLSWPAGTIDYSLFTATNLRPPIVWQAVTNSIQSTGGTFSLSLPATNTEQFYRLSTP
jgi:hypothetical protein